MVSHEPTGSPTPRSKSLDEVRAEAREEKKEAAEERRQAGGADAMVAHVLDNYELLRDNGGLVFAVSKAPGAPRVTIALGDEFTQKLAVDMWKTTGTVPGNTTLNNAITVVRGIGGTAQPVETHLRVAKDGHLQYRVDLGRAEGQTVLVRAGEWTVEPAAGSGPIFRRSNTVLELPEPERGGSRDVMRKVLRLDDKQFALMWGWCVAANFCDIARPILWGLGVQGSGKTTAMRAALALINPSPELGRSLNEGSSESEAAYARYVPSYDNVQTVKAGTSEFICTLVTGAAVDKRQLYTDDTIRTLSFRRAAIATSRKVPGGLQDDALERIVFVPFDRIGETERTTESQIARQWESEYAKVLGALYDDMAAVLGELRRGVDLPVKPRMADYAEILAALDSIAPGHNFLQHYLDQVHHTMTDRALDDPLLEAVVSLVEANQGEYKATVKTMLGAVTAMVSDDVKRERWFPTSPKKLGDAMREHSESLRAVGIEYLPPRQSGRPATLRKVVGRPTNDTFHDTFQPQSDTFKGKGVIEGVTHNSTSEGLHRGNDTIDTFPGCHPILNSSEDKRDIVDADKKRTPDDGKVSMVSSEEAATTADDAAESLRRLGIRRTDG